MSSTALRITVGALLLGLAGTAIFGAISVSGKEWAIPLLWASGFIFLLAAGIVFLWPAVARLLVGLGRRLERRGYRAGGRREDVISLHDLLPPDGIIRNLDIRDAFIVGPAVILRERDQDGLDFTGCSFDGYDHPQVWVQPGDDPMGALRVLDCQFYRCRFQGVAWALPIDEFEEYSAHRYELEAADQPPSEDRFSSDGLEWRTLLPGNGWRILVHITPDRPLPQPLEIQLECNQEPVETNVSLYRDRINWGSETQPTELPARIIGRIIRITLREPKLAPPALVSVLIVGRPETGLAVDRVRWLVEQ